MAKLFKLWAQIIGVMLLVLTFGDDATELARGMPYWFGIVTGFIGGVFIAISRWGEK